MNKENFKRRILPLAGKTIGLPNLIKLTNKRIINVFYHTIADKPLKHISHLYKHKNLHEFERDLDFLLANFKAVSTQDVLLHVKNEKIIKFPAFHLSFDDGLHEIYDVVLPILKRKGVPATVFVNSDFVDNKALFFRYKASLIIDKLTHLPV